MYQKMLSWYLQTDDTFLFYLEHEGSIIGYCGGMIKKNQTSTGSASGMAQHSFNAAVQAFLIRPWLLFHPELRNKYRFIFRNLMRKFKGDSGGGSASSGLPGLQQEKTFEPYAALVVIGITKAFQGRGLGARLLAEFENKIIKLGLKKMLLTVRTDNTQAIKSYQKSGWTKTDENKFSTTMIKSIIK